MTIQRDGNSMEFWPSVDLSAFTPSNLAAKSDGKKVYVSWSHVLVEGVIHPQLRYYRIYHSIDNVTYLPVSNISINFPRAFSFFPDLDVGTHYFKVSTVFKNGYESPLSTMVEVVHYEKYGT